MRLADRAVGLAMAVADALDYVGVLAVEMFVVGGELLVNTTTTHHQQSPAVARASDGGFVAVWQAANHQDFSYWGVFDQRFSSSGTSVGGETQVNEYFLLSQQNPAVALSPAGRGLVVWESEGQDGSAYGVYGRALEEGAYPESEFRVNSYTFSSQHSPAAARSDDGSFIVVWASVGQDGSSEGIYAVLSGSGGWPGRALIFADDFESGVSTAWSSAVGN